MSSDLLAFQNYGSGKHFEVQGEHVVLSQGGWTDATLEIFVRYLKEHPITEEHFHTMNSKSLRDLVLTIENYYQRNKLGSVDQVVHELFETHITKRNELIELLNKMPPHALYSYIENPPNGCKMAMHRLVEHVQSKYQRRLEDLIFQGDKALIEEFITSLSPVEVAIMASLETSLYSYYYHMNEEQLQAIAPFIKAEYVDMIKILRPHTPFEEFYRLLPKLEPLIRGSPALKWFLFKDPALNMLYRILIDMDLNTAENRQEFIQRYRMVEQILVVTLRIENAALVGADSALKERIDEIREERAHLQQLLFNKIRTNRIAEIAQLPDDTNY